MADRLLFPPTTVADMRQRGWDAPDFVYVSGDAYVDHPSFGAAVIVRTLEAAVTALPYSLSLNGKMRTILNALDVRTTVFSFPPALLTVWSIIIPPPNAAARRMSIRPAERQQSVRIAQSTSTAI